MNDPYANSAQFVGEIRPWRWSFGIDFTENSDDEEIVDSLPTGTQKTFWVEVAASYFP